MMQTKEHQQPFFKPLAKEYSQLPVIGYLNRNSQGLITRNNDLDALQSSSIQNQDSNVNGERLISLHAKLHQEADKIRKWKNQTEIELKQKDWKIQEAMQTTESLRKSILELQLQNESLSLKLQEEMNSREEVLQRLTATRDLINLLKDYSAKTEERLLQCETERTELKYLEKEHITNFEDLSEKFRNLEISTKEDHNRLSKELNTEVEEKNKMQLEWELKFAAAKEQLKTLMENCDEKDIEIRDIRTKLQKDSEKIHTMGLTIDDLDKQLITCQEEIDKTNFQLSDLKQELEDKKGQCLEAEKLIQDKEKEIEDYIIQRHEMKRKFQEAQETNEKRISELEDDLKSKQNELMDYKDRLQETEKYLEKAQALIEEVKSSKDMLLVEKTDIENQLTEVKIQKEELLIQQDENCIKLVEMSNENMELKSHLAGSNEKIAIVERDLNILNSHFSAKCEEVKGLVEKLMQITEEFEKERYERNMVQLELEKTRDNFSRLEMNLKENRHDIIQLEQQLRVSTEKNEELRKELENKATSDEQFRQTVSQQEQKIEEQKLELANLQKEKLENDKRFLIELESKSDVAVNLEKKISSLKNEITSKNKQIKDLEKEIKNLKSLIKCKDKTALELEQEINRLTESLEEKSVKINKFDERLGEMEAEVRSEKEKANSAIVNAKSMKKLADDSMRKQEETIHNCDYQIAEMMSTVEKYKKDNEKILSQKDKEISALKLKFKDSESCKKQEDEKILILKNETEELKMHLEEAKTNMNDLKVKFKERDELIWCLQKENKEKKEEIVQLQKNLEDQQISKRQYSCIAVQTSPKFDFMETTSKPPSINQPKPQPKTPLISHTTEARTPVSAMKTPQRSSLKSTATANSAMKKRKVFFCKDSSSGCESSSSELMEVEEDVIENRMIVEKANPLLFRPSPCIRTEEMKSPGAASSSKPMKHFTNQKPRSWLVEMEKENINSANGNLRKTPTRTTGKFFKSSPKHRMKKEKEDLSWFEMDSIFGFGPED